MQSKSMEHWGNAGIRPRTYRFTRKIWYEQGGELTGSKELSVCPCQNPQKTSFSLSMKTLTKTVGR